MQLTYFLQISQMIKRILFLVLNVLKPFFMINVNHLLELMEKIYYSF